MYRPRTASQRRRIPLRQRLTALAVLAFGTSLIAGTAPATAAPAPTKAAVQADALSTVVSDTGGTVLSGRAQGETGALGVTFGFEPETLQGDYASFGPNQHYTVPMYVPDGNDDDFWDNYVEELLTAGVNYVAVDLRGFTPGSTAPSTAGDPRVLTGLVDAINRRGAGDQLKIAALDDTPASLQQQRNLVDDGSYGDTPFDVGNPDNYKFLWDYDESAYFAAVPDDLRYKVDGRPLIYEWSLNSPDFTDQGNGNAAELLAYARSQAEAQYGEDPYYVLDQSWVDLDPTVQADGADDWFGLDTPSTVDTYNGQKFGVAVPGYNVVTSDSSAVIDRDHGNTLVNGLNNIVNGGSSLNLVEGFTDVGENAAADRMASGTYDQTMVDYPNQDLNILRRFSTDPFPSTLRIEAESADSYLDTTPGNSFGSIYRAGDLDVQKAGASEGGWNVGNIASGEYTQWQELPMQGTEHLQVRVASPNAGGQIRFVVDGVDGPVVNVPDTGDWQTYQTVDAGTFQFSPGTYHTVRVEAVTGGFNFDYWQAVNAQPATGQITGYGGKCVDDTNWSTTDKNPIQLWDCTGAANQSWTVENDGSIQTLGKCLDVDNGDTTDGTPVQLYHCDGNGSQKWVYNTSTLQLVNPQSGKCLDATGPSSADGTKLQIWSCTGGANQQWSLPQAS